MADRRVTFLIGANVKQFTKGLRSAEASMRRFGRKMERAGRTLTRSLTLPIVGAATMAVRSASKFETLRVQMEVLTGSAEAGARAFERLKRFSARTPFQLQDLTRANNTLMGFGLSAEEAFTNLQMLGDVAAVTGGDLQAVSVAFGQAAAEGRLMTRDIRQLINQGVPAIKLLAESMGVAQSEVLDLASAGEITFDVLVKAFQKATREGGQFANGTERLAETLAGVWSTLKDNVSIALGELGQVISETLNLKQIAKDISTALRNITENFRAMSDQSRTQMLKVAGVLAISGPVAFAIGKFVGMLSSMLTIVRKVFRTMVTIVSSAMGRIGIAFLLGIAIGQRFVDNMTAIFTGNLKDFSLSLSGFAESAVKGIGKVFKPLVNLADKGFGQLADGIGEMTGMKGALQSFWRLFEENTDQATQAVQDNTEAIKENRTEIGKVGAGGVTVGSISGGLDLSEMKAGITEFKSATEAGLQGAFSAWEKFVRNAKEAGFDFVNFLSSQVASGITSFAESVGLALSGAENEFATGLERVLLLVTDFAKQLGSILIGIGTAIAFVPGLQGPAGSYIAAGAALVAIASGVGAGIKKRISNRQQRANDVPGMAHGGIVPPGFPNDSFPAMLSSGEMVLPSPKPLPAMGGQVIENVINIDGKTFFRNQKEVTYRVGR